MIVSREKIELNNSIDAAEHLSNVLRKEDRFSREQEHFWVIILNAKNKVKFVDLISLGTPYSCYVQPREVFRRAISLGAYAVIIGHNHPSGDSRPSEEDVALTKKLIQIGSIIGIEVKDHVIIGDKSFSFKEAGVISKEGRWEMNW
jgi:DNA repair protein RadC